MKIPKDKLAHAVAGLLAALVGIVLASLVPIVVGAPPDMLGAASGALVAATAAGVTKEAADAQDNRINPGMHGVELADAIATALPGWAIAALLIWLQKGGV